MKEMRAYKTEIKLNEKQKALYKLCISAQKIVWNLFIEENNKSKKYINNYDFSKWLTNTYLKEHKEMLWLKEAGNKTLQHTINIVHKTYAKAFKEKKGFPKKKSCKNFNEGYYFVRMNLNRIIKVERHKIKVPMFGWIFIKEKGYLPSEGIISGTIKERAGRYFISVITNEHPKTFDNNTKEGIGIDLGLKELMTCSNGFVFSNINKTTKVKKLEKKLKRKQRALSRKYEEHKKNKELTYKNIEKNKLKIQRINFRLNCLRENYINKCVEIIIEQKPKFITLENLNIKGMLKNKYLSKSMSDSKLCYTKQQIINKAKKNNIEVREVDRFYPSSKTCSNCGNIKKDLKLKDRIYECPCGLEIDRDLNAALNLKKAKEYKILTTGGLPESNDCGLYKNLLVPTRESIQDEAVKSQFILHSIFDTKRNLLYNKYKSIFKFII